MLGSIDPDHNITITGSRCPGFDGAVAHKPGKSFWLPLLGWLETGTAAEPVARVALAGQAQIESITQLRAALSINDDVWAALLSRNYSASTLSVLTAQQADDLIADLRRQLADRERVKPLSGGGAPAAALDRGAVMAANAQTLQEAMASQQAAPAMAATKSPPQANDVLAALLAAKDSYLSLAIPQQPGGPSVDAIRTETWTKILSRRGVKPLEPVPGEVALELTATLEKKIAEMVAAQQAAGVTCAAPK